MDLVVEFLDMPEEGIGFIEESAGIFSEGEETVEVVYGDVELLASEDGADFNEVAEESSRL